MGCRCSSTGRAHTTLHETSNSHLQTSPHAGQQQRLYQPLYSYHQQEEWQPRRLEVKRFVNCCTFHLAENRPVLQRPCSWEWSTALHISYTVGLCKAILFLYMLNSNMAVARALTNPQGRDHVLHSDPHKTHRQKKQMLKELISNRIKVQNIGTTCPWSQKWERTQYKQVGIYSCMCPKTAAQPMSHPALSKPSCFSGGAKTRNRTVEVLQLLVTCKSATMRTGKRSTGNLRIGHTRLCNPCLWQPAVSQGFATPVCDNLQLASLWICSLHTTW